MDTRKMYGFLLDLNEDNYEAYVDAKSEADIVTQMVKYYDEHEYFDNIVDVDTELLEDELGEVHEIDILNEEEKQKKEYIEGILQWDGPGAYCLVGRSFGADSIMKVKECLGFELEPIEFPLPLNIKLLDDPEGSIAEWKQGETYKNIYFIDYVKHIGIPSFNVAYVVYSDEDIKDMKDIFSIVLEKKNKFIGEFDILGANYVAYPVEDFDVDDLCRYTFTPYENIYLED